MSGEHARNAGGSSGPIALAAGGTGGHMFPAEALAQELRRRGYPILLVTDERGARYAKNFPADDRFQISAATPSVGGPVAKAAAAFSIAGGLIKSLSEFRRRGVRATVGFGGYPSLPAVKAAAILQIPYAVHEQNGVLGRANRVLAGRAAFIAHGFANLEKVPSTKAPIIEIGNPVRDGVTALMNAPFTAPEANGQINLLAFGGSQGASLFSSVIPAAIANLPEELRRRLSVVQQARETEQPEVEEIYERAGVKAEIAPFFADMPARLAASHLVIARAGASTVSEISTIGRPSVLIPLGIAMDDHQTGNARALSDVGAAVMMPEKEFTAESLSAQLARLLGDGATLSTMAAAAQGSVKPHAATVLADRVEQDLLSVKNEKAAA